MCILVRRTDYPRVTGEDEEESGETSLRGSDDAEFVEAQMADDNIDSGDCV